MRYLIERLKVHLPKLSSDYAENYYFNWKYTFVVLKNDLKIIVICVSDKKYGLLEKKFYGSISES